MLIVFSVLHVITNYLFFSNLGVKFGNAAVAGITGVTINFPVDLCKTRLQNAETGPNGEKIYKSL